jgi:hypothetical protein
MREKEMHDKKVDSCEREIESRKEMHDKKLHKCGRKVDDTVYSCASVSR